MPKKRNKRKMPSKEEQADVLEELEKWWMKGQAESKRKRSSQPTVQDESAIVERDESAIVDAIIQHLEKGDTDAAEQFCDYYIRTCQEIMRYSTVDNTWRDTGD